MSDIGFQNLKQQIASFLSLDRKIGRVEGAIWSAILAPSIVLWGEVDRLADFFYSLIKYPFYYLFSISIDETGVFIGFLVVFSLMVVKCIQRLNHLRLSRHLVWILILPVVLYYFLRTFYRFRSIYDPLYDYSFSYTLETILFAWCCFVVVPFLAVLIFAQGVEVENKDRE